MFTYLVLLLLSFQAIHTNAADAISAVNAISANNGNNGNGNGNSGNNGNNGSNGNNGNSGKYDRLTPADTAVLFVEFQSGLLMGVADQAQNEFRNGISALIGLAQAFNLPVVITTINEPVNGPLIPELTAAFPNAPVIRRQGEINAWNNPDVVKAVKQTKAKKLLIAGMSIDGCVAYAALSAKDAGYAVYPVVDASGTWSPLNRELAIQRLFAAGVTPINWYAAAGELQNDWRNPTAGALYGVVTQRLPFYGDLLDLYYASLKK